VIEERVVTRLGATRPRSIDVRIVAATNRDLEADSRHGRLRPDLYFRLNGVALLIPPLRDRPREIEALAGSFLSAACRDMDRAPPLTLSTTALEVLGRHAWPGNVRELRNAIERAAVMCTETTILPEHLPPSLLAGARAAPTRAPASGLPRSVAQRDPHPNLRAEVRALERSRILDALERCAGNQSGAARQLGMPRRTLVSRLAELGLTRRQTPDPEM
jgi:two-component system, NtrC family, response regulator AtoC